MPTHRPRRFDLIAFDWDGTLYDSTRVIVRCIQQAVLDVGGAMPTEQAAAYVIGMSLGQALARAAPDVPEDKYAELGVRYRHHYLNHQDDLSLFDGVPSQSKAIRSKRRGRCVGMEEGLEFGGQRRFERDRLAGGGVLEL